eukprot:2279473-Amphidinium_carterae.1
MGNRQNRVVQCRHMNTFDRQSINGIVFCEEIPKHGPSKLSAVCVRTKVSADKSPWAGWLPAALGAESFGLAELIRINSIVARGGRLPSLWQLHVGAPDRSKVVAGGPHVSADFPLTWSTSVRCAYILRCSQ